MRLLGVLLLAAGSTNLYASRHDPTHPLVLWLSLGALTIGITLLIFTRLRYGKVTYHTTNKQ
jgi:hypothetical protein